jgi:hypothetical protein
MAQKFPTFHGLRSVITVFTKSHHWFLSWTRWINSTSPNTIPLKSILILFSHIRLGYPIPLGLPIKISYALRIPHLLLKSRKNKSCTKYFSCYKHMCYSDTPLHTSTNYFHLKLQWWNIFQSTNSFQSLESINLMLMFLSDRWIIFCVPQQRSNISLYFNEYKRFNIMQQFQDLTRNELQYKPWSTKMATVINTYQNHPWFSW